MIETFMIIKICRHGLLLSSQVLNYLGRALNKRENLVIIRDNFCYFNTKTYVVTPHLNRLVKMVQMRGHNMV